MVKSAASVNHNSRFQYLKDLYRYMERLPEDCNIGAFLEKSPRQWTKPLRKHLANESAFDILFNIGPPFLVVLGRHHDISTRVTGRSY